jgi:hypothetical protein
MDRLTAQRTWHRSWRVSRRKFSWRSATVYGETAVHNDLPTDHEMKYFWTLTTILLASACEYVEFPSDMQVSRDAIRLAPTELPPNFSYQLINVSRLDGDSYSVSFLASFRIKSPANVVIREGWLKGNAMKAGETKNECLIEVIYWHPNGRWKLVNHGLWKKC